ncbi:hypothetical protein BH09VER1_BH09VER1_41040 [soil metagenome]
MKFPFACLLLALAVSGCATSTFRPPTVQEINSGRYETLYLGADGQIVRHSTQAAKRQDQGFWNGDGVSGAPSIVIDLGDQQARFYKGGKEVGMSPISSGREGYNTPSGNFSIIQKDKDHLSTLYGDYVDASGNVIEKNIGVMENKRPAGASFVGAPMPYYMRIHNGVGMHAGYLPGVPASHGCIRMPESMAEIFYENAPEGTPVKVIY